MAPRFTPPFTRAFDPVSAMRRRGNWAAMAPRAPRLYNPKRGRIFHRLRRNPLASVGKGL